MNADELGGSRLDDVARKAGVSTATVSRYFNSPAVVAPATAERIRAAVVELNYIPNLLAGSLASSRSRHVAVLVPHLPYSIFDETIEAMVEELSTEGVIVMLCLTGTDPKRTNDQIMAALGRRVEAIITTGIVTDETRDMLRRAKATVIEIWGLPLDPVDVAVGFSHFAVGRDIARFAHQRGYRYPHIITARGSRAQRRRDGFVEEWGEIGGQPPTEDTVQIPSKFGHGRAAFAKLGRLDPRPDVVICGSDFLAQGLIVEAMAAGLSIPGDLAVIGFGNSSLAGDMRPTITSVDIDGARIAREAIAILRRRAGGDPIAERRIDVGFRLIARESA